MFRSRHQSPKGIISSHLFSQPDYFVKDYSIQPPGSFMIAELIIEKPDEELDFGLAVGNGIEYVHYGKRKDLKNSTIYVYVRNLSENLAVSTSFDPAPRKLPHKEGKFEQIRFYHDDTTKTINVVQYLIGDL
ncbi:hypothetical protein MRX96_037160 [Rhipicephalus microplus]